MTITQEKTDALLSTIKVQLKQEDYEPQVKKQLKDLNKVVQLKGFRPGMVPPAIIKRMYGNSVLADELNKKLNDEVYKYINDNKLEILASPMPAESQPQLDLDINSLKDIDFDYQVGLAPEVDLGYLESKPTFTKYRIQADDKMIDDEVMRIRERFATYEYPEAVGEKDMLTVTIEELDENGQPKIEGINTVSSLAADLLKPEYRDRVMALHKHESIEADVFDLMDRDRESMAKNILNLKDLSALDQIGNRFKITLDNITRKAPAVINEEFFHDVYGDKGPKTEEEMRENIKQDLEAYFDGQTDSYLVNELYKGMMDHVEFPLPDDFLKRWIKASNDKPISNEEVEEEYPAFAKSLRWSLIQKKIKEQQQIEVSEDEIKEQTRQNVTRQLYGYGLNNIGAEWIEKFVDKQMADKKAYDQTRDSVLEHKVLGYIKGKAQLTDQAISLEDFKALVEKK